MIVTRCNAVLADEALNADQKIEAIKDLYAQSEDIHLDQKTGQYLIKEGVFQEEDFQKMNGLAVNLEDRSGWTLLERAAKKGELDIIKWCITEQGANVNHVNHVYMTALYAAVDGGHTEVVKYLIAKGANVNRCQYDRAELLPLYAAISCGDLETTKIFLARGAFTNRSLVKQCRSLLSALSDLAAGIRQEGSSDDYYSVTYDQLLSKQKEQIPLPTEQSIKEILALLGPRVLCHAFIKTHINEAPKKDPYGIFEAERKVGAEFIDFIKAMNKVPDFKRCPADLKVRILSFLCGSFYEYLGTSQRIREILIAADSSSSSVPTVPYTPPVILHASPGSQTTTGSSATSSTTTMTSSATTAVAKPHRPNH